MREYKVTAQDLWAFISSTVFMSFVAGFLFLGLEPTALSLVLATAISIGLTMLAVYSCRLHDWAQKRGEQDAKESKTDN